MRALPERAVAGFTDALIAERLPFLDVDQRARTAQFVVARWRLASQPVQLGTGAVASALGATAWSLAALSGSDPDGAWRTVVHGLSGPPPRRLGADAVRGIPGHGVRRRPMARGRGDGHGDRVIGIAP